MEWKLNIETDFQFRKALSMNNKQITLQSENKVDTFIQ